MALGWCILTRLGVRGAIEGGVEGSDISGESEIGERFCGADVATGDLKEIVACVAPTGLALRVSDMF